MVQCRRERERELFKMTHCMSVKCVFATSMLILFLSLNLTWRSKKPYLPGSLGASKIKARWYAVLAAAVRTVLLS